MDKWMTLDETAEYLQVSKDSIYRLAQKAKIPASKIGNLWRFKKEEIDEWMRLNRKESKK
ncbi:MAG: helix-turn-helix domain-containing protein [Candidatus Omnitrophica bacterium]|nr:helix-turn-helix domain-containing protein [Candidatus Omnitrophota bacterium]